MDLELREARYEARPSANPVIVAAAGEDDGEFPVMLRSLVGLP